MRNKGAWIGGLFAALFAAFFLARGPRSLEPGWGETGLLLPDIPSDPSRVALHTDSLDLLLVRDGETWRMEEPLRDDASGPAVRALLDLLRGARRVRTIASERGRSGDVGLDPPRGELRIDGETVLLLGAASPEEHGVFVRRGAGGETWLADASIAALLDLPRDRFRDRTVLGIDPGAVEAVIVRRAGGVRTARRVGPNRWRIEEAGVRADAFALAGVVALLVSDGVHSFQDDSPFDRGTVDLAYEVRWGGRTDTLLLGTDVPGTALVQARASGRKAPFRLPRHLVDSLGVRSDRLLDRRVFEKDALGADSVSYRSDAASFDVVRAGGGGWKVRMGETLPADPPRARAFLRNLQDLRAARPLEAPAAEGAFRAACRIAVDSDAVEIGEIAGELAARRDGETGL
ncbi:MAG: DUF4340 domain-containing protein, partial [Candidatus Latescibacterota bacterium]